MDHLISAAAQSADSPFIEGTTLQYAWDSVSITSFLSCPRRYQYQIIYGLTPHAPAYRIALVFGILFHKGLEVYHRAKAQGLDHDSAVFGTVAYLLADPATATLPVDEHIDNMKEEQDDDDDGMIFRNSKIRTRYYLIRAVVWYLEHYADDPFKTILLPSGAPAVELSFRLPLPIYVSLGNRPAQQRHQLLLCGHIDRGVEFNNFLYSSDYKTSKSLTKQWFNLFDLSHQMTGYTVAGKIIFDRPVSGGMIDGVALQVGQVRFGRAPTLRTQGQIGEYMETLQEITKRAADYAERDYYPMNTASCFLCDFKEVCRQAPEYRAGFIKTYYSRQPGWNPLENR